MRNQIALSTYYANKEVIIPQRPERFKDSEA